ncbi:MAG: hypothetical protein N2Z72_09070 [Bacteroidales bacterium]|nr:hypothetical protein [Bacteroidales bacterium]
MKQILFLNVFLFFMGYLLAQSTYYTPYSRFGFGFPHREGNDALAFTMGGMNIAYASPFFISYQNPSGLAMIGHSEDSLPFLFSGNVSGQFARIQSQNRVAYPFNMSLNSFGAGFKIFKNLSLGMGFAPLTTIDYKIRISDLVDTFQTVNTYEGKGGLNNAWLGAGIMVRKYFLIGLKFNYLYGSISHDKKIVFSGTNFLHTKLLSQDFYQGIIVDGGLICRMNFNDWEMSMGISGKIRQKISEEITFHAFRYYISGDFEYIYDTVAMNEKSKGNAYLPSEWKWGLFFLNKQYGGFGVNASYTNWSTYSSLSNIDTLKEEIVFSAGGFITLDSKSQNFFKRSTWVLGMRYEQIPFVVNHQRINSVSGSVGIIMPLAPIYQKLQQSKLIFGIELGNLGTLDHKLIRQQYVLFKFGMVFSEKWFEKRFYR